MSAAKGLPFLSLLDGTSAIDGPENICDLVSISSTASGGALVAIALARLKRQVGLLDELTCMPLGISVKLEPLASALCASLTEVENLLTAAVERLPNTEGGAA